MSSYGSVPNNSNDSSLISGEKSNKAKEQKISGKAWGRVKNILTRPRQYPCSIYFILGNELCERFSYYGMRAILILYLTKWLKFNEDVATSIFHAFVMVCYFSPVVGAVLADGYLGRYKTILYVSIVYAIGNLVVAATAVPPPEWYGPAVGLILIGLGTGGIKPCVSSFGADQFRKDQEKERYTFFSAFYFMINLGSMVSIVLTPILRADVHCYGTECYPLAFGVPAALMVIATIIFVSGTSLYKRVPPTGNLIGRVVRCIWSGLCGKIKHCWDTDKKEHWLYYAEGKFEVDFIEEVKILLKVLFMFIPAPFFWALSDQQGSRWTLQAEKMNGDLGVFGVLKPDQMSALNPLLILILIPLFEKVIYPGLDKCKIPNRPLQRMVAGMFLTVVAFVVTGLVQLKIESTLESPLKESEAGVTFINTINCDIHVQSNNVINADIPKFKESTYHVLSAKNYSIQVTSPCLPPKNSPVYLPSATATRVFISSDGQTLSILSVKDMRVKPRQGKSRLSIYNLVPYLSSNISLIIDDHKGAINPKLGVQYNSTEKNGLPFKILNPGRYHLYWYNSTAKRWTRLETLLEFGQGAVYTLVLSSSNSSSEINTHLFTSVEENTISMLLMVPQYFIITVGEVLFSVTGLAFAYSQAPLSMKSVVQAAWLLTTAVGSLVVVIVAQVQYFTSQVAEFMFFAALMLLATIVFMIMSMFYQYFNTSGQGNGHYETQELVVESENEDIPLKDANHQKQN